MNLNTQIISLIYSFVFGVLFSICTNLNYRFLFNKRITFKIIITVVYVLDSALLYFIILKHLNDGLVHSYFILFIGVGYLISSIGLNKYIDNFKKKLFKTVKKCKQK